MLPVFAISLLKLNTNPDIHLEGLWCLSQLQSTETVPWLATSATVFKGRAEEGVRRETQEGKGLAQFLVKHLHLGIEVRLQWWSLKTTESLPAKKAARVCLWKQRQWEATGHTEVSLFHRRPLINYSNKSLFDGERENVSMSGKKNPTKSSN